MIPRSLALMVMACAVGCFQPDSTSCTERVCPRDYVCAPNGERCVLPEQIRACEGLVTGDTCTLQRDPVSAVCAEGVCIHPDCGNGILEPGEACDDGNIDSGDDCSPACQAETCGNGVRDADEQCDCGDGTSTPAAECNGRTNSLDAEAACRPDCRFARCGDGVVDGFEYCEPAAGPPADSCVDLGYDLGEVGCSNACSPDLTECRFIGWRAIGGPNGATAITGKPGDVYALAGPTSVRHFDGRVWTVLPPPPADIHALWANGVADLFAAGTGMLLHWNGAAWSMVTSYVGSPTAMWGASATEIWIAIGSLVVRWNGVTTSTEGVPAGSISALWTDGTEVFAIDGAAIAHRDASGTWSRFVARTPLAGIWGATAATVFAVGEDGMILRRAGTTWTEMATGTKLDFVAVAGSAPDDVYAIASTTIMHFDGAAWVGAADTQIGLRAVAVVALDDVVVAGAFGVQRTRGAAWMTTDIPDGVDLTGVAGYNASQTAIAQDGTILIQVAGRWSMSKVAARLNDIWLPAVTPVTHIAADRGRIYRRFGQGPVALMVPTLPTLNDLTKVFGTSYTDFYALGSTELWHCTGTSCSAVTLPPGNSRLAGWATPQLRITGDGSEEFVNDGSQWTPEDISIGNVTSFTSNDAATYAATGTGVMRLESGSSTPWLATAGGGVTSMSGHSSFYCGDELWLAGFGTVSHQGFYGIDAVSATPGVRAVTWGADCYAVSVGDRLSIWYHYGGVDAAEQGLGLAFDQTYDALWAGGLNQIWATTHAYPYVWQSDGALWSRPTPFYPMYPNEPVTPRYSPTGTFEGLLFTARACGDHIFRFTRLYAFDEITMPATGCYTGIWGSGADNIYAVGSAGAVYHSTDGGLTWTPVATGATGDLTGIWGSGPNDVFLIGADRVIHFDGASWTVQPTPPIGAIAAIGGSDATHVFIGGTDGRIARYDGASWVATPTSASTGSVIAISGADPTSFFAVTDDGQAMHFTGSRWIPVRTLAPPRTVMVVGHSVFFGSDGRIDRLLKTSDW